MNLMMIKGIKEEWAELMTNTKGNKGEWAELAVKCYFIIYGGFTDGISNKFINYDVMLIRDSKYYPMTGEEYGINNIKARKLLTVGLEKINSGHGRTFENGPILLLSKFFGIEKIKASAHEKEDIILIKDGSKSSFSIENVSSSRSSFVNASSATRITYKLVRMDGKSMTIPERTDLLVEYGKDVYIDGKRKVKSRVQEIYEKGYTFEYSHISNINFRNAVFDIGHSELGCLCIDFLKTRGKGKILDILSIHEEHTDDRSKFNRTRNNLLVYIRRTILETTPTGEAIDEKREIPNNGMIFLHGENIGLYAATNIHWWETHILKSSAFDTPDSKRHDYGYVYCSGGGDMLFDYSLGIRGSFKGSILRKKGYNPDRVGNHRMSGRKDELGRFI